MHMSDHDADSQPATVTAITLGVARGAATRVTTLARRLPIVRLVGMAEILAARIQLGLGGVALMILAQLVGDLIPARRR
jgi:hypothetical protein